MKYAIPMNEKNKDAKIASILGRAKYFAIYDTEKEELNFLDNPGAKETRGAGNLAARKIGELGVDKIITIHIGPNAENALKVADVEIVIENDITLNDTIEKYSK